MSSSASPNQSATAAFFDLDGTLLRVNSGALWIRRERRLGRLSLAQYVEAIAYLIAYRLDTIDMAVAMRRALLTIKGETEETVRTWTREWYLEEVASEVAPGAWPTLRWHREAGHQLVLLTTSSPYASALVAEQLGLDAFLSSRYEVQGGVFTGEPLFPLCYGDGKVQNAERFAAERGIDLDKSYFYSDSASDLPMLRRVKHARVVNPDLKLRIGALRAGWPVLDWRS
jgi:HAD superfamily hydrolase (TIGR01490 family)